MADLNKPFKEQNPGEKLLSVLIGLAFVLLGIGVCRIVGGFLIRFAFGL